MDLEEVYASYGSWIRARVRTYLPDAWEDGVQEVLLKLQPALGRMRETSVEALRALVSRTVRSVCIDELRRRARRPAAVEAAEIADPAAPEHELRGEAEERDVLLARVRAAWDELAERDRQVLALRFRDGLSFREIAEVLDVPQGSVAGWYSRAVARLKEVPHEPR